VDAGQPTRQQADEHWQSCWGSGYWVKWGAPNLTGWYLLIEAALVSKSAAAWPWQSSSAAAQGLKAAAAHVCFAHACKLAVMCWLPAGPGWQRSRPCVSAAWAQGTARKQREEAAKAAVVAARTEAHRKLMEERKASM